MTSGAEEAAASGAEKAVASAAEEAAANPAEEAVPSATPVQIATERVDQHAKRHPVHACTSEGNAPARVK